MLAFLKSRKLRSLKANSFYAYNNVVEILARLRSADQPDVEEGVCGLTPEIWCEDVGGDVLVVAGAFTTAVVTQRIDDVHHLNQCLTRVHPHIHSPAGE